MGTYHWSYDSTSLWGAIPVEQWHWVKWMPKQILFFSNNTIFSTFIFLSLSLLLPLYVYICLLCKQFSQTDIHRFIVRTVWLKQLVFLCPFTIEIHNTMLSKLYLVSEIYHRIKTWNSVCGHWGLTTPGMQCQSLELQGFQGSRDGCTIPGMSAIPADIGRNQFQLLEEFQIWDIFQSSWHSTNHITGNPISGVMI